MSSSKASSSTPKTVLPGGIFFLRGWLGVLTLTPLGVAVALSEIPCQAGTFGCLFWSVFGASIIVAGLVWRTWAMLYVGGRKTVSLVQTGPYSLSRHPLYFGTFLVGIGAGVMLQSITWTAAFLVLFPLIYMPVIAEEERALRLNHEQPFDAFVSHVPNRILPRWRDFQAGEKYGDVHMKAQWNQAKRALLTLAAIPAIELIQTMRTAGTIPAWWHLF
jgi:protein-S-isoprenylcysteine O-methyltransferase Ste14